MTAPPPVPALPDTPRLTTYAPIASAGPFNVGFAIYGDSSDYAEWIDVYLDGVQQVGTWTLSSPSGSLITIARPITDAQITFTAPITGNLAIAGAERPRRLAQNAENRGVSARDFNQTYTAIIAMLREAWDLRVRLPLIPAGETTSVLPAKSLRALMAAGWDSAGNWIAQSYAPAGAISASMADVCAAPSHAAALALLGGGAAPTQPIGQEAMWPGLVAPALWKFEDGSSILRSGFPELLAVLAPTLSCVVASGSNIVTGFASTKGFGAGWPVEGAAFAAGTTIASVLDATRIQLNQPAIDNGATAQLFPYGTASSTTFNLPLVEDGSSIAGLDATQAKLPGGHVLNAALGEATHILTTAEMPAHNHGVTDPTHQHGGIPSSAALIQGPTSASADPTFMHPTGANSAFAATGISIQNTGGGTAHNNVQPTRVRRFIIYAGH